MKTKYTILYFRDMGHGGPHKQTYIIRHQVLQMINKEGPPLHENVTKWMTWVYNINKALMWLASSIVLFSGFS